jgi:dihydrofolate reductase
VGTPAAALAAAGDLELFVIGGAEVFSVFWPQLRRLELTEVHGDIAGDTRLLGFDRRQWRETFRENHAADDRHAWPFSFVTLERR